MRINLLIVSIASILCSCSPSEQFAIQELPSGREIKIISVGRMHFSEDTPALMLKYLTDIDIDNVELLRKEAEEIWPVFRVNVQESGLSNAIITATGPRMKKNLFFYTNRNHAFILTKKKNGTWDFESWNRDYDNEAKAISDQYIDSIKNGNTLNAYESIHYPDHFTSEQLNTEIINLSKATEVIIEELGSINSNQLSFDPINYRYLSIQSASPEYWNRYPYFNSLVYDVEYSKKGAGYLVFRFSMIDDRLVINSIMYGIPADDPESEMTIKMINDDVMKKLVST